jgi:hypothetical protein
MVNEGIKSVIYESLSTTAEGYVCMNVREANHEKPSVTVSREVMIPIKDWIEIGTDVDFYRSRCPRSLGEDEWHTVLAVAADTHEALKERMESLLD